MCEAQGLFVDLKDSSATTSSVTVCPLSATSCGKAAACGNEQTDNEKEEPGNSKPDNFPKKACSIFCMQCCYIISTSIAYQFDTSSTDMHTAYFGAEYPSNNGESFHPPEITKS